MSASDALSRPGQREREDGVALVEFALILPVLIMLVVGMFDLAFAVWWSNTLTSAAREGTRYAIVHGADSSDPVGPGDDGAVVTIVRQQAVGLRDVTVTVSWPDQVSTTLTTSVSAGTDTVQVASTTGFTTGDDVTISLGTSEEHRIKAILSSPERLQLDANLANGYGSGATVATAANDRGKRVKVIASAPYAPVLSQAFLGGALRVTLGGSSELVISR
jgi:Flp pilus assembly protein TadG